MPLNPGSSGDSGEPEFMIEINSTPLIDVMLVLLVMIIITIPIQLHSVRLEMPVGAPPTPHFKPQKIQIDIDADSVVYWQGVAVSPEELDEKMSGIAASNPQPQVHVRPNRASRYATFANVLARSKRLGLSQIAVVGAEQFAQ